MGQTRKHVKNYEFDLDVKFQGRIWIIMYETHHLMMTHPCAKYNKPMLNQKKLWAGHKSAQTDRVIPIDPPKLRSWGYN